MEIIKIKIDDLKPYEKNAKIHTREQIEQIKKSIEQFGMNDPIAVWGEENLIVEGHGRLEALKELGYNEIDCIRLDHLTDEERKAYTLAHNKLTMNTDFDYSILDLELDDIKTINMEDFGFELGILDNDEFGTDFNLPEGEKGNLEQMTFTLAKQQAELIKSALELVKNEISDTFGNENKNGNAIYEVVKQWAEQRK